MLQIYIIIILILSIIISVITLLKYNNNRENYIDIDGTKKPDTNKYYLKLFDGDVPLLLAFNVINKENVPITFGSKLIVDNDTACEGINSYSTINVDGNINRGNVNTYNAIVQNTSEPIKLNQGGIIDTDGRSLKWRGNVLLSGWF